MLSLTLYTDIKDMVKGLLNCDFKGNTINSTKFICICFLLKQFCACMLLFYSPVVTQGYKHREEALRHFSLKLNRKMEVSVFNVHSIYHIYVYPNSICMQAGNT